ncbi:39S ribosomal protein L53, mitochondrial [Galendromus occidentalis]|uniref:Large ribosomal subunit protein mL53 n=1 Tax=Galendromus occidentalis TaxID=34638 RepID=A0AAJ6QRQ5_9ACAR|nr:39S ribosomal protein L53, mitochondrial [Galendromus occidentalis]
MTAHMHRQLLERTLFTTLKNMQLRPVKRMNFQFDPFHPQVSSIRDCLFHMNGEKLRLTNPSCSMKTEIVCDRSPPRIDLLLNEGQRYRILTENLTLLEVVQQLDKICRQFDPKKEEESRL